MIRAADAVVSDSSLAGNSSKVDFFRDGEDHLKAELERFDIYLRRRVYQFIHYNRNSDKYAGNSPTYISDPEVEWLLSKEHDYQNYDQYLAQFDSELMHKDESIRVAINNTLERGIDLPLVRLAQWFNLGLLEFNVIVLCLAPELRRKYDRVYAYLQDDITRKRPSIDLFMDLFIDEEYIRWQTRGLFDASSPLLRHQLIAHAEDTSSPSGSTGLAEFIQLDKRILHFLLGNNHLDRRLDYFARLVQPQHSLSDVCIDPANKQHIQTLIDLYFFEPSSSTKRLWLHLQGVKGVGRKTLALGICSTLGCSLLVVNMSALLSYTVMDELSLLQLICRESVLLQAPVYLEDIDLLDDKPGVMQQLIQYLNEYSCLCFSSSTQTTKNWKPSADSHNLDFHHLRLGIPDSYLRSQTWLQQTRLQGLVVSEKDALTLANQFALTPGQIASAVKKARLSIMTPAHESVVPVQADIKIFSAACREESNQQLTHLAVKITPHYDWNDLVLNDDSKSILQSICQQVSYQTHVFGNWGFGKKIAYGRGLSVLFAGSPGTGKTMAAQVMANDLQLDLYKIDLASVVSKYIGETEKNLDKIFKEAERSNAILFFDEADALLGKRTEVADAHDRYANIEVSFLLQKMEEYDGIVIMATNLRSNMDDAFIRRIRFILEFPFPDKDSRLQIWQKSFPDSAPLADDVDFEWLAGKIKTPGGNIKNIVLNAAFYAAADADAISMKHILKSCKYEFQKIGKLWDEGGLHSTDKKRTG